MLWSQDESAGKSTAAAASPDAMAALFASSPAEDSPLRILEAPATAASECKITTYLQSQGLH